MCVESVAYFINVNQYKRYSFSENVVRASFNCELKYLNCHFSESLLKIHSDKLACEFSILSNTS